MLSRVQIITIGNSAWEWHMLIITWRLFISHGLSPVRQIHYAELTRLSCISVREAPGLDSPKPIHRSPVRVPEFSIMRELSDKWLSYAISKSSRKERHSLFCLELVNLMKRSWENKSSWSSSSFAIKVMKVVVKMSDDFRIRQKAENKYRVARNGMLVNIVRLITRIFADY